MPANVWGVDSAARVTRELYDCVVGNLGKPAFWGRYLTTIPGRSDGLSAEEIALLHRSGVKVLPIYNAFDAAVGYRNGQVAAHNAVFHALRLGAPKGTVIFANVERFFAVDEAWIRGWVDAFFPSGFKPGIYHDPLEGGFSAAYCEAARKSESVRVQTVLWSAEPDPGPTKKANAPAFAPASPPCEANVWAWQYGRDAEICPVDTNLIDTRLFAQLW